MKNNKKIILIGLIVVFALLGPNIVRYLSGTSSNNDYVRITDVEYKAEVVDEENSQGKVLIVERLTFDVHAASEDNLFWELWRDLPEQYVDGVKVSYKVNSVKQIFEDGSELVYEESPRLYWDDWDYVKSNTTYGPGKWYHSEGPYSEYWRQYECVLFYVDGLYRENVVFEIEYEMINANLRYNDSSELYLSMYSGDSAKYLKSFKGQILIPSEKMPETGNYDAHTFGTNSNNFPFTESNSINPGYHTFLIDLTEEQLKFKSYNEYIEFTLVSFGEDKHSFSQFASVNDYYYYDVLDEIRQEQIKYDALPGKWNVIKLVTLGISLIATFLIIKNTLNLNKRIKKKYNFYEPTMEMDYFRDIPSELDPNFSSELVFCKSKSTSSIDDGYSAIMLSLASKGYIELEQINASKDWNQNNVKIVVKDRSRLQPRENVDPTLNDGRIQTDETISNLKLLTLTEEYYFNLILRHSKGIEISLNSFQDKISNDYEYTNSFVKNIKSAMTTIGISQSYFQTADYKKPQKELRNKSIALGILGIFLIVVVNLIAYKTRLDLAFGAFFILGIACLIYAVYMDQQSKKYVLLTQFGEDEYAKWRGLYNFLDSETLMNERTVVELFMWEQYLVYATAFGISEKVIKALKVRCPDMESSPVLRNQYYHSRSFYVRNRSFSTATRAASFNARSGGHGGYGGGGRGGGGGGGGH